MLLVWLAELRKITSIPKLLENIEISGGLITNSWQSSLTVFAP